MTEGTFPKVDGDVLYASEVNTFYAGTNNVVTSLEVINQATTLAIDAGLTDKTYTYANTDIFIDATGQNNTVDSSSGIEYDADLDGFILALTIYDNFSDNSFDAGLWTKTETTSNGAATVTEQNTQMEFVASGSSNQSSPQNASSTAKLESDTDFDVLKFTLSSLSFDAGGSASQAMDYSQAQIQVLFGATVITDKIENLSDPSSPYSAVYNDLVDGVWLLIKDGADSWNLYLNGTYKRNFSGLSGHFIVNCQGKCQSSGSGGGCMSYSANVDLDTVYYQIGSSGTLTTTQKTITSNVDAIFTIGTVDGGGTFTYDVSTDGGSTEDATAQSLSGIVYCDGDNTDVILTFNLSGADNTTPIFKDYAYQVWI